VADHSIDRGSRGRLSGRLLAARFKLGELLQRGGAMELYEAQDQSAGAAAAVAVITGGLADEVDRLEALARTLRLQARQEHPNLVVPDSRHLFPGSRAGRQQPLLAGASYDGPSLAAHIRQRGSVEVVEACTIMTQVLSAVGALHEAGLQHGWLEPERVCLRPDHLDHDDHVRIYLPVASGVLLEEIVARLEAGGAPVADERTRLAFAAPEVLAGDPSSYPADIFSAGAMLYFCLAGRAPLEEQLADLSPGELLDLFIYEQAAALAAEEAGLPAAVLRVVSRAMAKDPDLRPSLAEFMEAMDLLATPPLVTDCRKQPEPTEKGQPAPPTHQPAAPVSFSLGDAARQAAARRLASERAAAEAQIVRQEESEASPVLDLPPPIAAESLPNTQPVPQDAREPAMVEEPTPQEEGFTTIAMAAPPTIEAEPEEFAPPSDEYETLVMSAPSSGEDGAAAPTETPPSPSRPENDSPPLPEEEYISTAESPPQDEDYSTMFMSVEDLEVVPKTQPEEESEPEEDDQDDEVGMETIALSINDLKGLKVDEDA